jgi:hypothetical protein
MDASLPFDAPLSDQAGRANHLEPGCRPGRDFVPIKIGLLVNIDHHRLF